MRMMSKLALPLFVLALVLSAAGQNDSKDEKQLSQLLNEFLVGAGRNDAVVHDRFWADDLIYTRSSGARIGKGELMKGVRNAPAPIQGQEATVFTASEVRIQRYGKTAVVAFRLVATSTRSDGLKNIAEFLNTGTFVKRKGLWKAVAWQATAIPKPKT